MLEVQFTSTKVVTQEHINKQHRASFSIDLIDKWGMG